MLVLSVRNSTSLIYGFVWNAFEFFRIVKVEILDVLKIVVGSLHLGQVLCTLGGGRFKFRDLDLFNKTLLIKQLAWRILSIRKSAGYESLIKFGKGLWTSKVPHRVKRFIRKAFHNVFAYFSKSSKLSY